MINFLTASTALAQMQQQQLSSIELLDQCWQRIKQREAQVQAWTYLAEAKARQQAATQDQQRRDRPTQDPLSQLPLGGIPVGVKDIFATVDMPTTWGFPPYRDRYLSTEAAVVTQLKAAGAIILGKTVTTELATAAPGPTRNPHHLAYTPGGSSSGSAAAVADGMVPIAIGSQTMGSVLRPAAYCGIFGFKPSFGLISRDGMMPVCPDLDQVGWFARSIEDLQAVLTVFAPSQSKAREPMPPARPLKLAWVQTPHWSAIAPDLQDRLQAAIGVLEEAGLRIEPVSLPPQLDDYWETAQTLCAFGLYQNHGGLLETHVHHCSPALQDWFAQGRKITPQMYQNAYQQSQIYREEIGALLAQYDAILTPATENHAPVGLMNTGSPRFCALWTMYGGPAMTLPLGNNAIGLPLAAQLVGAWGQDQALLQIAAHCWPSLEATWGTVTPPLSS